MIHTLTLNPSIDVTFTLSSLRLGEMQRLSDPTEYPGGKGMNVSLALQQLGMPSIAWALLGGDRGERWKRLARRLRVPLEFIPVAGETRQNIKIFEEEEKRQTDLNLPGPNFDAGAAEYLASQLSAHLRNGDYVVLAGSGLPKTPDSWWEELATAVRMTGARLLVDTSGRALKLLAKSRPWALKINLSEYNDLKDCTHESLESLSLELKENPPMDSHFIVTDGREGALGCPTEKSPIFVKALNTPVHGTVGAGDAFTAGWLTAWSEENGNWEAAMKMASATAAGAVELPGTSFPSRGRVLGLLEEFR